MSQVPVGFPTLPELTDPGFRDALQRNFDDLRVALGAVTAYEPWITVGGAGAPAFQNGWANFGGGLSTVAFYKDNLGNVVLKGQATGGVVGAVIFTLPAGYLPLERRDFACGTAAGDGGAGLTITAGGTVIPTAAAGNARVSLDGLVFKAEQ